jgi:MoxR-like ATPase
MDAGTRFRDFFDELRGAFHEREPVFTQIELALLCREHVLVTGPPGTAKSAIAQAVLGRIVDERTGEPSLYARQISELTVHTDLVGAVDFKVLTETGRTEHLVEEGMLGATHGFLDEVFDGRDMLLRSILDVLHERELKHGRKVTRGRTETVIMTSNRYLSEVLARSPELLLAFADRLSFISYVPKGFARPASRAAMLSRAAREATPELRARLTLQAVDALQDEVERVEVPGQVMEALELLADALERELQRQVTRLPDYVPTKYFSHRTLVKALWALKAAVVRDRIYLRPRRELRAEPEDLQSLRAFFLLGGPRSPELEALLERAVDPRERAQLEILRLEHRAFDLVFSQVLASPRGGAERERSALGVDDATSAAEALARRFDDGEAASLAESLRSRLSPGPRYAENRTALVSAARLLVAAARSRLGRRDLLANDGSYGATAAILDLAREVPELEPELGPLAREAAEACAGALEVVALAGDALAFEVREDPAASARAAAHQADRVSRLARAVARADSDAGASLERAEAEARARAARSIRSRIRIDPADLPAAAQGLGALEEALVSLSPSERGLKAEMLSPLARAFAEAKLRAVRFHHLSELSNAVHSVAEQLAREGLPPAPVLGECRPILREQISEYLRRAAQAFPMPDGAGTDAAYVRYRQATASRMEGQSRALAALASVLSQEDPAQVERELARAVAAAELAALRSRISFLEVWLDGVLGALPDPSTIRPDQVDRAFDALVKSRLPALVLREGELVRVRGALQELAALDGGAASAAAQLATAVQVLEDRFESFSRLLIEARMRRS